MAKAKKLEESKAKTAMKNTKVVLAPSHPQPLDASALPAPEFILAVDFDGVIHSYDGNWEGNDVIMGNIIPGAADFLYEAVRRYQVHVYSVRCSTPEGRQAITEWLVAELGRVLGDNGVDVASALIVAEHKPFAHLMIDDRAWRFEGEFPRFSDIDKLIAKPFAAE